MGVNEACMNTCWQGCFTFLRSRVPWPFPAFSTERNRLPGKPGCACLKRQREECAFKESCMLNRPCGPAAARLSSTPPLMLRVLAQVHNHRVRRLLISLLNPAKQPPVPEPNYVTRQPNREWQPLNMLELIFYLFFYQPDITVPSANKCSIICLSTNTDFECQ